eukprot:810-Heterococcus_DN1.PRE.4
MQLYAMVQCVHIALIDKSMRESARLRARAAHCFRNAFAVGHNMLTQYDMDCCENNSNDIAAMTTPRSHTFGCNFLHPTGTVRQQ